VGQVAARWGVPYLLDACQSAGQVPLDVEALGCTALAATGRKYLRGPRGTGILWMKDCGEPFTLDARGAVWTATSEYTLKPGARRYELWERNIAGLLGLGVALAQLHGVGIEPLSARIASLAETLRAGLPKVKDRGLQRCGIVTFVPDGIAPYALKAALRDERMNVSVSEVDMTRLDMEARGLNAVVRASVHAYNTEDEVARFCAAVGRLS
jgi:selenocysteine lyase/cysteine desulfurase